jgi:hypothetical protein
MTFDEMLTQVLALLQREKRVSYRVLKRRVVYLSPADNSPGPVWSCPRDVNRNRTVLTSHIGYPRPG